MNKTKFIRLFHLRVFACSVIFFLLISSCKKNPTEPEDDTRMFGIEAIELVTVSGTSLQFKSFATLEDGTNSDVTGSTIWRTSPGGIGTINNSGLFTSIGGLTGEEKIIAEYRSFRDSVIVSVLERPLSFAIYPAISNIPAGKNVQMKAFASYGSGSILPKTENIKWSINPETAATIDENGKLTSVPGATGLETITAVFFSLESVSKIDVQANYIPRFEMVEIPAGSFSMGDDNGSSRERPQHDIFLDAYTIGKYEITNAQYAKFLNDAQERGEISTENNIIVPQKGPFRFVFYTDINDSHIQYFAEEALYGVLPGYEEQPVVRLTWYGAEAFCQFYGYRLPTEAEWEKACRGGLQYDFGTSDGTISHDLANYLGTQGNDSYETLAPVGSFPPNPYGIYDMSGNAAEFVFDLYAQTYYAQSPGENPIGPEPHLRTGLLPQIPTIVRGGSWSARENSLRSAARSLHVELRVGVTIRTDAGIRVANSIQ